MGLKLSFYFQKSVILLKKGNKVDYQTFKTAFADYPLFSTKDIELSFPGFDRNNLLYWQEKNYIQKKRNKGRQSLKVCEVKLITHMDEELMGRIRQINIEQSIRQEKGFGAETPVDRYIKEKEQWIKQIKKDFALNGREWWGAYYEGILTAPQWLQWIFLLLPKSINLTLPIPNGSLLSS